MKKLMLVVAIVAAAFGAKASTVSWQIMNVKSPSTGANFSGGSAYVFFVAGGSADTSWVAALEGKGASAVTAAVTGHTGFLTSYTQGPSAAAGNYSWNAAAGYANLDLATVGLTGGTAYAAYAVIFDTATITDDSKFYVTNVGTGSTFADTVTSNKNFSIAASSSATATNWKAVGGDIPEPTSGILLIIGGAMLALRRRRA